MQTILGAGGAIGTQLARTLQEQGHQLRLVARQPKAVTGTEELISADLLDAQACQKAVAGATVAYLTVGLPYDNKYWQTNWPKLIDNVIAACAQHNCKLVFFDNIYMYAKDQLDGMTEQAVVAPTTVKGQVRKLVANKVMDAHQSSKTETLIARAADFYGPSLKNSVLGELVINPILEGKRPQWLCDAQQAHSFTWTPDAAKATAQLGNDPEAYGRVWHLPTSSTAPTGVEWAQLMAKAANQPYRKPMVLPAWSVKGMGLFNPSMKALHEMLYQYDRPYRFDSSAFTARYGWTGIEPEQALGSFLVG